MGYTRVAGLYKLIIRTIASNKKVLQPSRRQHAGNNIKTHQNITIDYIINARLVLPHVIFYLFLLIYSLCNGCNSRMVINLRAFKCFDSAQRKRVERNRFLLKLTGLSICGSQAPGSSQSGNFRTTQQCPVLTATGFPFMQTGRCLRAQWLI